MEAITKRKLSIDEYHRMAEAGIIRPDERVELINGEIIEMSPIGKEHALAVRRINRLLHSLLDQQQYIIDVQTPLLINEHSEPEPDLMIMPFQVDLYADGVYPSDVLLLIEVSDTTVSTAALKKDLQLKLPLYAQPGAAQAGIPEVWIVDTQHGQVAQYTDLENGSYRKRSAWKREDSFSATMLPLEVDGKDIIG
jgi:Uma2 family endonuclease